MKTAFITTCMGRRQHASQSAAQLMSNPSIDGQNNFYVFVDFACPQHSGDAIQRRHPQAHIVWEVEYGQGTTFFHKSRALNLGAYRAKELGAEYLVFLDVDTLVSPELLDYISENADPDRFMIMLPNKENRDLCGFLGVATTAFQQVGGFDQRMLGWGAEDLDMRLKLLLRTKMQWTEVPCKLATILHHSDELRNRYSPFSSKQDSNQHNLRILDQNVRATTGLTCRQLFKTPLGHQVRTMLGLSSMPEEPRTENGRL